MKDKSREFGYAPLSVLQQTLCVLSNRFTRLRKQKNNWIFERALPSLRAPSFWVLESVTVISEDVTMESYFIHGESFVARSELYKLEDGSVVAFQDTINGENGPLHMDETFKSLYEGEDQFNLILKYAGVLDPNKLKLYRLS